MEYKPKPWYQSFKLIAGVVGLVLIFVNAFINRETIDPDTVTNAVMAIIGFYIASKAYEDGEQAKARAKVDAPQTTTVSTPGGSDVTVTAPSETTPPTLPQPFIERH